MWKSRQFPDKKFQIFEKMLILLDIVFKKFLTPSFKAEHVAHMKGTRQFPDMAFGDISPNRFEVSSSKLLDHVGVLRLSF